MNNIELYEFLTEGEPKRPCRDGCFFSQNRKLSVSATSGRQAGKEGGRQEGGQQAGSRQRGSGNAVYIENSKDFTSTLKKTAAPWRTAVTGWAGNQ